MDWGGNAINQFARSDYIRRNGKIFVPVLEGAAKAYQTGLRKGYAYIMGDRGATSKPLTQLTPLPDLPDDEPFVERKLLPYK